MNIILKDGIGDTAKILNVLAVMMPTYLISENIFYTFLALLVMLFFYYLDKESGVYFDGNLITIKDGIFFKKTYIYEYDKLKELNIKNTFAPGLRGKKFYLLFEDGFKYNYYTSGQNAELDEVKIFLRNKDIFVDDDDEPPIYGS